MYTPTDPLQNADEAVNRNKRPRGHLRTRIIAWSFVPTAIILSAVAWITFYSYQNVLGDLAVEQDWVIAQSKAVQAQTALADLLNAAIRPIILTIDIDYGKPIEARAQNILDQSQGLDILDGGIYFLDQRGLIFKSHPIQPGLIGQDWSDTPQFRFLAQNPPGSSPITDLRITGPDNRGFMCATWPMHNMQREFIGAGYYCLLVGPGGQGSLFKTWSTLDLGSDVYIIDGNQVIVYSPDPSRVGKDISQESYLEELLQGPERSIRVRKAGGEVVVSFYPLANVVSDRNRFILIKEQSLDEIMQPSLPYTRLLLVLLALGVIVPVLVTAYGVRHITEPIQKLIQAAGQVTKGQFKQHIAVKTGDEIETLADQFNLMSAELDESYASLEKRVADRTRELAIMNAVLSVASRSLDVQEILAGTLGILIDQMGYGAGGAYKLEPDPASPVLLARRGIEPAVAGEIVMVPQIQLSIAPGGHSSRVAVFDRNDIENDKLCDELGRSGCRMLVFVPLPAKGRDLGFILLGRPEPGPLTPEEQTLLGAIGQQVGVALETAYLYERAGQIATTAERSRLARELHDAVTQTLFSANLIADVIPRIWKRSPEEGLQSLEELRQLTRGALAEMRTLLLEMRPESLERADLKSLLTQLADAFIGRVRVPVSVNILGECDLPHEVKTAFYRVAQEALHNIAKHAGARHIDLRLECQPGHLNLSVKDDGLGFDLATVSPEHLGIAIMRERADAIGAELTIESQLGQGTTIRLGWNAARKD